MATHYTYETNEILKEILAELKKLNENWEDAGECEDCCGEEDDTEPSGCVCGGHDTDCPCYGVLSEGEV